jgi:hypothetical protein
MPSFTHTGTRVPMSLLEMGVTDSPKGCSPDELLEDLYRSAYGAESAARHLPDLLRQISTSTDEI